MNDIEKLNSVKFNIRKALESQGSDITVDTPFEEYPKYVMELVGGGSGGETPSIPTVTITIVNSSGVDVGFYGNAFFVEGGISPDVYIPDGETITFDTRANLGGRIDCCMAAETDSKYVRLSTPIGGYVEYYDVPIETETADLFETLFRIRGGSSVTVTLTAAI